METSNLIRGKCVKKGTQTRKSSITRKNLQDKIQMRTYDIITNKLFANAAFVRCNASYFETAGRFSRIKAQKSPVGYIQEYQTNGASSLWKRNCVFCFEDNWGKHKFCWYKFCNNIITFWRQEIWILYYPETYISVWLQFTVGNLSISIVQATSTANYLICYGKKKTVVCISVKKMKGIVYIPVIWLTL